MRKWIIMLVMVAALCPAVWAEEPYPEEWGEVVDSAPMTVEEFRDTTPEEWLEKGVEVIRDSLRAPLRLSAGMITALVVTSAVRSASPSALSEGAASALDTVSAAVLFVLCAPAAEGLLNYAQEAFSSASQYLTAFVPVFAATGKGMSFSFFAVPDSAHPVSMSVRRYALSSLITRSFRAFAEYSTSLPRVIFRMKVTFLCTPPAATLKYASVISLGVTP